MRPSVRRSPRPNGRPTPRAEGGGSSKQRPRASQGAPPIRAMTTTTALSFEGTAGLHRAIDVEIVIPVYIEEADLASSILQLHRYLSPKFALTWIVTIADNASRDQTWGIACGLANQLDGVRAIHLEKKGRGRAPRVAWSASRAAVAAYMDVDLSTDLDALLPLVAPLLSGHSDVAIGSRLAAGARVIRGPKS